MTRFALFFQEKKKKKKKGNLPQQKIKRKNGKQKRMNYDILLLDV
jgi:hypothetical protein